MTEKDIHIVLPAFNEGKILRKVVQDLKSIGYRQIHIINDGSTDNTAILAKEEGVDLISHVVNRGAGAASQTAIAMAKQRGWDILVLMDADGQHKVNDVLKLHNHLSMYDFDIVIGNRFVNQTNSIPLSRIWLNRLANKLTNVFCSGHYQDTQSGFRILNRKAIEALDLKVDGFGFCSEMIIVGEKQGLKIGEAPIEVEYSEYSLSKGQSFGKGLSTAFNFIWRVIFN